MAKPDAKPILIWPVPLYQQVCARRAYAVPTLKPWQRWRERKGIGKRMWSAA